CFVVEEHENVTGTLGTVVRRLLLPDGREATVAYFGDLKVEPAARKGLVFLRLAWAAEALLRDRTSAGFGVVMDGTPVTPEAYTGQLGIPVGRVLGKVLVWQFPCRDDRAKPEDEGFVSTAGRVLDCYRRLSRGRYATAGGLPAERSE